MNIVIPAAGAGSRFKEAGYKEDKPFIKVPFVEKNQKNNFTISFDTHIKTFDKEIPMIDVVLRNLQSELFAENIYIIFRKEQISEYVNEIRDLPENVHIIQLDKMTEGAVCTVLKAKDFINNDEPLLIANSDQWMLWSARDFYKYVQVKKFDACIPIFPASSDKWSFAKIDEKTNLVTEVAEKKPISNHATVGLYYFKKGKDFVKSAEQMIKKNIRVNNEFYVCPVFNEFIESGGKVGTYPIIEMWGLGTPEDLKKFIDNKPYLTYKNW